MSAETPGIDSDKNRDTKTFTSKTPPATPTTTIPPFEKGGAGGIIPKEPGWIHHLDIWASAETEKKSGRGRSGGNGGSVYGIQKLRELILELAVRGQLVPQDPNDEPAGELLKRIQAEKAKLIAEGKIKKDKPLSPITDEEKPFELPQGWEWARIGQIGHDWGQKIPDSNFTYIEVSAIDSQRGIISSPELVKPENAPSRARKVVKKGTVIYSTIRPYLLNIAIIEKDFLPEPIASTAFAIVHPFCSMPPRYFLCFFRSPVFVRYVESVQMGIAYSAINDGQFFSGLIPLPPIEEQHRIVAKVDELMTLCDQLETQHNNAAEAHKKLVNHLLGTLTQSHSADDFSANWQRIAVHFESLFITETSIDALKQTLLQLAVMGKLVPQDPNDEPASELLKRIQAEKARLIAEGKIKKGKSPLPPLLPRGETGSVAATSINPTTTTLSNPPLSNSTLNPNPNPPFEKGGPGGIQRGISEEEKPFELPIGWEIIRLGELVKKSGAGWSPNCEDHPRYENDWGVLKVIAVSWGKFLPDENKALPKLLDARLDCVVETGDFLVSRANTAELVARSVVVEDCPPNLMLSDKIVRLRLSLFCDSRFINIANSASFARNYYSRIAGGTSSSMKNVTREQILNLIIALPPLPEQHRIVAKVDELMTLCDQLKSTITQARGLKQKLADVIVEQAVSS